MLTPKKERERERERKKEEEKEQNTISRFCSCGWDFSVAPGMCSKSTLSGSCSFVPWKCFVASSLTGICFSIRFLKSCFSKSQINFLFETHLNFSLVLELSENRITNDRKMFWRMQNATERRDNRPWRLLHFTVAGSLRTHNRAELLFLGQILRKHPCCVLFRVFAWNGINFARYTPRIPLWCELLVNKGEVITRHWSCV